jgi:thiamine biosynthesis lipoprotein
MTTRCKPLLGSYVEISTDEVDDLAVINHAFSVIERIQNLMGFHDPKTELNQINQSAHLEAVEIHPWTAQVIQIGKDIHQHSGGLFNCGIGHRLVAAGLLPRHTDFRSHCFGGIEDVYFLAPDLIAASKPVCLDLGGIAKGFAVDIATRVLMSEGIQSGYVNAGGDLRVFGNSLKPIHIRNPLSPHELFNLGNLQNTAIATSSHYFSQRDQQRNAIINPLGKDFAKFDFEDAESYSVIARECVYADALTKVLALSQDENHPCFAHYSAQAIRITQ